MSTEAHEPRSIRFGVFTADLRTGELRKDGRPVALQPQPFHVLAALASRPGQLVTKDELMQSVWQGAFVTDEALTYAIWELRKALDDDAKSPRFIQTVPRRGYRFIASVESGSEAVVAKSCRRKTALVAALALIALGAVWAFWQIRSRSAAPVSPNRLAVLPFSVRGSDAFTYLGEGMVDLLSATLNTESQPTVDPKTLVRFTHHQGGDELDMERGARVAEHFGAGRYLLGSIVESDERLRIHATVYDTVSGAIRTRATVEGAGEELFDLVDDLTAQLLVGEFPGPRGHFPRVAAMTTQSLEALKAYLEGEKAAWRLESRDHEKAHRSFQRAVEIDPTFALAWYKLSEVAGGSWQIQPAEEYLAQALRYAHRLSERERLAIRASAAAPWFVSWEHSAEKAERLYLELLEKYPDDADAWDYLAELYLSCNWSRGRAWEDTVEQVIECEERAQRLDPSSWAPPLWLGYAYLYQGRLEEAARQWRKIFPEGPLPNIIRAHLALGREDWPAWERLLEDLRNDGGVFWPQHRLPTYLSFADLPDHPERIREFVSVRDLGESRSPGQRASGHITLAMWAAGRGQWTEAMHELAAAELLYPAAAYELGTILSLAPFLQVPEAHLLSLRDKLKRWNPEAENPKEGFPYPPGFHRVLRPYLLGLLCARLGDEAAAARWASELGQIPSPELMPSMPQDYAESVRAHVALNEGHFEDALALLEQTRMDAHGSRYYYYAPGWLIMMGYERFLRAELLHKLGRDEEALGWYWPNYSFGGPQYAFAHLRIAEIREKQRDFLKAAEHYDRFIRFWKDCDPDLRPILEAAKSRLAILEDEIT